MVVRIGSNILSQNIQRQLGRATDDLSAVSERLSSGQRINRASDDAAGLAIHSSLSSSSRVFAQGVRNINDGISALNIADGALAELTNVVVRQQELAEQAANGVFSMKQREALDKEANALVDEFNRIVSTTEFNGMKLLDGSFQGVTIQAGFGLTGSIAVSIGSSLQRKVGDGTFTLAGSAAAGGGPYSIAAVDLNNDGKLDVVTGSIFSDNNRVALGNGDGTLQTPVAFGTTGAGQSLSIGTADFNKDGNIDAVFGNAASNSASVMLGTGTGTFQTSVQYATTAATQVNSVVTGDFNRDGNADFVTASSDGYGGLFIGNGNGTFQAGMTFQLGSVSSAIRAADLNGDGFLDLVSANNASNSVSTLLGNGQGAFSSARTFTVASATSPIDLDLGDINHDGYIDVVTAARGSSTVGILLGRGDGTLSTNQTSLTASYTYGSTVRLSDLNGDGKLDILASDKDTNSVSTFLGVGNGTFRAERTSITATGGSHLSYAVGDFNGDGVPDLTTPDSTAGLTIMLANTSNTTSIARMYLLNQADARSALDVTQQTLQRISAERSSIGANFSRLTIAASNLAVARENYAAAASRIMDVDVAEASSQLVRNQIMQSVAAAVLAQANNQPQVVLNLLRG